MFMNFLHIFPFLNSKRLSTVYLFNEYKTFKNGLRKINKKMKIIIKFFYENVNLNHDSILFDLIRLIKEFSFLTLLF